MIRWIRDWLKRRNPEAWKQIAAPAILQYIDMAVADEEVGPYIIWSRWPRLRDGCANIITIDFETGRKGSASFTLTKAQVFGPDTRVLRNLIVAGLRQ